MNNKERYIRSVGLWNVSGTEIVSATLKSLEWLVSVTYNGPSINYVRFLRRGNVNVFFIFGKGGYK